MRGHRAQATSLRNHLTTQGLRTRDLTNWDGEPDPRIKVDTIHRAKGLDFAAIYLPILTTKGPAPTSTLVGVEWRTQLARQHFVALPRARDRAWIGTITPSDR